MNDFKDPKIDRKYLLYYILLANFFFDFIYQINNEIDCVSLNKN